MTYFDSLSDILSIVITALIAIGGAVWGLRIYIQRRQGFPKANLSQKVKAIKLTDDKICIHTSTRIRNVGDVMICIESATNMVLQILPLDSSIEQNLEDEEKLYDDEKKEIRWTGYNKEVTWKKDEGIEIEPGEEEQVDFDLLIPANIELIQVYTYFQNLKKKRDIGWEAKEYYDVAKLLSGGGE